MRKLLMFIALLSASLIFSSCGAEESSPSLTCSPVTDLGSGCGDIQACCNSTKCYYKAGGKKYDCNAFDCAAAAQQVVADVCNFGRLDANGIAELKQKLLELAIEANIKE
jgi:hypothetical protein